MKKTDLLKLIGIIFQRILVFIKIDMLLHVLHLFLQILGNFIINLSKHFFPIRFQSLLCSSKSFQDLQIRKDQIQSFILELVLEENG